jgi:putative ATP-grasp target RiPP
MNGKSAAARRTQIEDLPAIGTELSDKELGQVSGGLFSFGGLSSWNLGWNLGGWGFGFGQNACLCDTISPNGQKFDKDPDGY